jgi:hypothetical protein
LLSAEKSSNRNGQQTEGSIWLSINSILDTHG